MDLNEDLLEAVDSTAERSRIEDFERLRLEFTKILMSNNDLLHERSFAEICKLGKQFTEEYIKHGTED